MVATTQEISGFKINSALSQRIVSLSLEPLSEGFPAARPNERLEVTRRRKAERNFQHALCECIWWRLTDSERATIRAIVMAENPWYRQHPESMCFEMDCCAEIHQVLERVRHTA